MQVLSVVIVAFLGVTDSWLLPPRPLSSRPIIRALSSHNEARTIPYQVSGRRLIRCSTPLRAYEDDFDSEEPELDEEDEESELDLSMLDGDINFERTSGDESEDEEDLEDFTEEPEEEAADEEEDAGVGWRSRREEVRMAGTPQKRSQRTWEEQFDDDPLRGDSPTRDFEKPPERFAERYVAVGWVDSAEQLRLRQQAWVHHMQWARRSALLPNASAGVMWEFTALTRDSMAPAGQILSIGANSSSHVMELLASEPLVAHGAVKRWRLFRYEPAEHDNLKWEMRIPYLFLGLGPSGKSMNATLDQQRLFHEGRSDGNSRRVASLGSLHEVGGASAGALIVVNAVSGKDAERYLAEDPAVGGGVFSEQASVSPVNQQDIDGLHHIMARTFSQKTSLDPLHFQDPEDLLELQLPPLPSLPHHDEQNLKVLEQLLELNTSYRYSWLDINERYTPESGVEIGARLWNEAMSRAQKVRLEPVVVQADDGFMASMSEE